MSNLASGSDEFKPTVPRSEPIEQHGVRVHPSSLGSRNANYSLFLSIKSV